MLVYQRVTTAAQKSVRTAAPALANTPVAGLAKVASFLAGEKTPRNRASDQQLVQYGPMVMFSPTKTFF